MSKTDKVTNLLQHVQEHLKSGRLRYSGHANQRMLQRMIFRTEIEFVLEHGFHEKKKDKFSEEFKSWDYSIRGKTNDDRQLRIVVAFEKPNLLVVTAIDLDSED